MTIQHANITVSSTASPLRGSADRTAGQSLVLTSPADSEGSVFIGGPGVTVESFGYELAPGGEFRLPLAPSDEPHAVSVDPVDIHVLHLGLG